jgi:hypothetical protein
MLTFDDAQIERLASLAALKLQMNSSGSPCGANT